MCRLHMHAGVHVHPRAPIGEPRTDPLSVVVADAGHRTQRVTTARILGCGGGLWRPKHAPNRNFLKTFSAQKTSGK
jgi:hypothetical protein